MVDKRPLQCLSVISMVRVANILCAQTHTLEMLYGFMSVCVRERGRREPGEQERREES